MTYFILGAVIGLLITGIIKLSDNLAQSKADIVMYARMNSELAIEKRVLVDKIVALKRS